MIIQLLVAFSNFFLLNVGFLTAFWIRYGWPFPERNFSTYQKSFVLLVLLHLLSIAMFGGYKRRFITSWDLLKRQAIGIFLGTLFSFAYIYVFRLQLEAFPSSIPLLASGINLLLLFKFNQWILKKCNRIRKRIVIIGNGKVDDFVCKDAVVQRFAALNIKKLNHLADIDEIIISEKISNLNDLNLLLYFKQKLNTLILFSPAIYMELMPDIINGDNQVPFLYTFAGRQSDLEEFLIRMLDIVASLLTLMFLLPFMAFIAILIKCTSQGPVFYTQVRTGQNGKDFTLIKFRTMCQNAEKAIGPVLAKPGDSRVTRIGGILRKSRIDELPQLLNVIRGEMSLVGPRPERPHFVKIHKVLQGIRLAVRPGLTGLAQVRSFYDLHPRHKIKYDYLYIQRRSFILNAYILLRTIPVIFSKKGW